MYKDYFKLAGKNLIKRKLRSWLTILGIFIGIAAVVALVSISEGLKTSINDQVSRIGADKLFIQPKGSAFSSPGFTASTLTDKDLDNIRKVNGVAEAVGETFEAADAEFNHKTISTLVFGVPVKSSTFDLIVESNALEITDGRNLKAGDAHKTVIGSNFALKKIFGRKINTGDRVLIKGVPFRVVGILKKVGDPGIDGGFWISMDAYRDVIDSSEELPYIIVRASSGTNPIILSDAITRKLRRARGLEEGKEDFSVQTPEQLLEAFNNILIIVQIVLVGVAAISLIVGGIGIMNTMYTSVIERTKEIGIMKAVGAQNRDIMKIFLIESGLIGLVGGVIGIIIGAGISKLVEVIANASLGTDLLKAFFPPTLIIGSLLFAFIIGMVSGATPAFKASKLKPVDALRYE